jgi:hypothetical protein
MKTLHFFTFLLFAVSSFLHSEIPADISFLIVDYKYSSEHGIKICEIQNANVSKFDSYDIIYNEKNLIPKRFCNFLKQYQNNVWFCSKHYFIKDFIDAFGNTGWKAFIKIIDIYKEPSFLKASKTPIKNPHDLTNYPGAIYCRTSQFKSLEDFYSDYPNILVIDAATFPYQNDKLKISKLFDQDPLLAQYRPKWNVYPKKYTKTLAQQINNDLSSNKFVIKPHKSTLGRGIIIVEAKELDKTLKLIFKNKKKLKKINDQSYQFWLFSTDDSFLVEEFLHSDPIKISHLDNQEYDPTYRSTFVLYYHKQQTKITFLEHQIKVPEMSLNSKGSLNQIHKTVLKQPYYDKVADEQKTLFELALKPVLLKMYQLMLED